MIDTEFQPLTKPLNIKATYLSEPTDNVMLRAVILDTETTGMNYLKDKIIELDISQSVNQLKAYITT